MLQPATHRRGDDDREKRPDDAEDAEPDNGVEPPDRRQPDVVDEVRLPEPVVRLGPHADERGHAEDREQCRSGADEHRAGPCRADHVPERAALLAGDGTKTGLGHPPRVEGGERDRPDPAEHDRQS